MSNGTKIEWTDESWNPTRGCRRVSEGCRNCYAEGVAARFCGEGLPYEGLAEMTEKGPRWTGEGMFVPKVLDAPLRWTRPRMVFVNSMSDLFFEEFTFSQIAAVFGVMAAAKQHTFQVLTKRPERALEFFAWLDECADDLVGLCTQNQVKEWWRGNALRVAASKITPHEKLTEVVTQWPLPNVWMGVSAENQDTANERVPKLLEMPAAVRFVSAEPLLGPINFKSIVDEKADIDAIRGERAWHSKPVLAPFTFRFCEKLDWIIVGGESGKGAREMEVSWVEEILDDARGSDTRVFVKQMGKVWAKQNGSSDSKGGDMEDWPEHIRVRQFPGKDPKEEQEEEEVKPLLRSELGPGPSASSLLALSELMQQGRARFPTNYMLLEALQEEVGELADDILAGEASFREEALDVACIAMRIYEEGTSPPLEGEQGMLSIISLVGALSRMCFDAGKQDPDIARLLQMIKSRVEYRWGKDLQGGGEYEKYPRTLTVIEDENH